MRYWHSAVLYGIGPKIVYPPPTPPVRKWGETFAVECDVMSVNIGDSFDRLFFFLFLFAVRL